MKTSTLEANKRSALEMIGLHALLPGLTFAADTAVTALNQLRQQIGFPPFGNPSGIFAAWETNGLSNNNNDRPRRGRPPGSGRKLLPAPALPASRNTTIMRDRWDLVKKAALTIHGSPSESDAERARDIIAGVTPGKRLRRLSARGKRSISENTRRRWNLVREAGLKTNGLPSARLVAKAERIITARAKSLVQKEETHV